MFPSYVTKSVQYTYAQVNITLGERENTMQYLDQIAK